MTDVNTQIRDRIEAFVDEITELVRLAVLESVSDALGGTLLGGATGLDTLRRPGRGRGLDISLRRRGGKRTPDEIDATTRQVLDYVSRNPGQGVEQMAKALNTDTKELTLPIKKLLGTGQLTTEGQKRATKYYAQDGAEMADAEPEEEADEQPARRGRATARKRRRPQVRSSGVTRRRRKG